MSRRPRDREARTPDRLLRTHGSVFVGCLPAERPGERAEETRRPGPASCPRLGSIFRGSQNCYRATASSHVRRVAGELALARNAACAGNRRLFLHAFPVSGSWLEAYGD